MTALPAPHWTYRMLSARDLPAEMEVPDIRGPFSVPLSQFVMDWNWSDHPAGLILETPVYEGGNQLLLPSIAVVAHALADRDGVALPGWVSKHRAPEDVLLFGGNIHSPLGEWIRNHAPPACEYHRVWFDAYLLDKGTPCQWLDL